MEKAPQFISEQSISAGVCDNPLYEQDYGTIDDSDIVDTGAGEPRFSL